ncbi:hypothetical protein [Streptomyces poonensis]|uniref:Uncharacterized protein n=1 Tax=Streptomyces poonensis TaxID=68255 RepID=A0A918QBY6_9ACTN|nr:hypothetical protein [Streptomyces poonensis]GGZ40470.1 hypothetical protein GCM10010365_71530 [Streptomyces poonensis]GLJ93030.1 hypothetical protein GCM10017589_56420 [Streptomyces poonensis]
MTLPPPYAVRLADEIARQLQALSHHLAELPTGQAAQVLGRVLDAEDGLLGRVTALVITGSHFAKDQAERGALPAEVWLALGRAANQLDDIGLDLDEHADTIRAVGTGPTTGPAESQPAASALVVRRRR